MIFGKGDDNTEWHIEELFLYEDVDNDSSISAADKQIIGQASPTYTYGLGMTLAGGWNNWFVAIPIAITYADMNGTKRPCELPFRWSTEVDKA